MSASWNLSYTWQHDKHLRLQLATVARSCMRYMHLFMHNLFFSSLWNCQQYDGDFVWLCLQIFSQSVTNSCCCSSMVVTWICLSLFCATNYLHSGRVLWPRSHQVLVPPLSFVSACIKQPIGLYVACVCVRELSKTLNRKQRSRPTLMIHALLQN